jgi:2-oxoglutarate ferredoxin oxidoreductase subunit delta
MKISIDERRCKGCNLCTMVCPYHIFRQGTSPNLRGILVPVLDRPERCSNCRLGKLYGRTLCGMCQMICPDQAISWEDEKTGERKRMAVEF